MNEPTLTPGRRRADSDDEVAAPLDRFEQERAAGEGMIARPARPSGVAAADSGPARGSGDEPDHEDLPATSDTEHAMLSHERTSEPGIRSLQRGWQVHDRSGSRLGDIVERDDESFVVALEAQAGAGVRLPMRLVAEEDPDTRRVRLSAGIDELHRMWPPGEAERPVDDV